MHPLHDRVRPHPSKPSARHPVRSGGYSVPPGGVSLGSLLCAAVLCATASRASAQTRTVTVTNESSATVREIYIDDAEGKAPGGNRLRGRLPPNTRASITYSQGCRANVRIVLDDRTTQEHRGADVCARSAFAVTGGGAVSTAPPAGRQRSASPAGVSRSAASGSPGARATRGDGAASPPEPVPWTGRSITKKLTLDGYK